MNLKQIWSGFKDVMHTVAFVYFSLTMAVLIYTHHYQPELLELTIALPLHVVIVLILFAVLQNAIAGAKAVGRLVRGWTS